jgi:sialate O-acetylesterase
MALDAASVALGTAGSTFDYASLNRFTIAGKDGVYHAAQAYVSDRSKVTVWCEDVPEPVSVRYAWADTPQGANLYSALPLMPVTPFEMCVAK